MNGQPHIQSSSDLLLPRLDLDPTTSFRNEGIETSQECLGGGLLDTNSVGVWGEMGNLPTFWPDVLGELHPKFRVPVNFFGCFSRD